MTGMIAMLATSAVFGGALSLALVAIWSTIAPQWRRIARLAAGHVERPFQPLAGLATAERRIAVRRWAATPAPVVVHWSRAA